MGIAAPAAHADHHQRTVVRADWSAGAVQRGTGYVRPGGSRRVREVQRRLRDRGLRPGPIDGIYGPRTQRAVRRFQARHDLATDAIVGPRTLRALRHTPTRPTRTPTATSPPQAPVPQAAPERAPRAAPTAAPTRSPLPLGPVVAAIAALGLVVLGASYARVRRHVLRTARPGHGPPGEPAR
jgi:peptidoglycan hydrolase-like protein with peptidoglycan-binding domain